jgi:hypothetical protein
MTAGNSDGTDALDHPLISALIGRFTTPVINPTPTDPAIPPTWNAMAVPDRPSTKTRTRMPLSKDRIQKGGLTRSIRRSSFCLMANPLPFGASRMIGIIPTSTATRIPAARPETTTFVKRSRSSKLTTGHCERGARRPVTSTECPAATSGPSSDRGMATSRALTVSHAGTRTTAW